MRQPPSIRRRLLLALMLMTLLTLAMATGLSALMDLRLFRDHMLRDLQVLAAVVGESCVSALVFNSKESAEQRLATLAGEYQIRSATLYDAQHQPFALWQRSPAVPPTNVGERRGDRVPPALRRATRRPLGAHRAARRAGAAGAHLCLARGGRRPADAGRRTDDRAAPATTHRAADHGAGGRRPGRLGAGGFFAAGTGATRRA